jgi:hypothetical protein
MSEQMFNITTQFHAKLFLLLWRRGLEILCYVFSLRSRWINSFAYAAATSPVSAMQMRK